LIQVDNERALHDYTFTFYLKEGFSLVQSSDFLGKDYDTKEVYIIDDQNHIIAIISPAWARDAKGNKVNTYFTTNGNQLIQHIDFDQNSIFPIVADPLFEDIINSCAFAIAAFIGSTAFPIGKITKVKHFIQALGGLRAAVRAIKIAGGLAAAKRARGILGDLALELLGIAAIEHNCF
jgi:hypothetical protein